MNTERKLYQWDTGQKLTGCTGLYVDFPIGDEVYRVETADGMCIIPDELLQTSGSHKVYECMTNNTIRSFGFSVTPRPKPPEYVYTPTERLTFEGLVQKVDDAVADMIRKAESGEFDGHTPVKGTDYFTTSEIQQIQNEVSSGAIGEFKSVVDTETETFNTNAETKFNAYNQNDSQKFNAYNTNATEKLNAYNSNADNRVSEFNAQTQQIQTDISELKSDLDEVYPCVINKIEHVSINRFNPNTATQQYFSNGEFVGNTEWTLTDVIECNFGDTIYAKYYREGTTLGRLTFDVFLIGTDGTIVYQEHNQWKSYKLPDSHPQITELAGIRLAWKESAFSFENRALVDIEFNAEMTEYHAYTGDYTKKTNIIDEKTKSRWRGKNVLVFGDSISTPNYPLDEHHYPKWNNFLADIDGFTMYNYSVHGFGYLCGQGTSSQGEYNMIHQIEKAKTELENANVSPDLIILFMGTNDYGNQVDIGTFGDGMYNKTYNVDQYLTPKYTDTSVINTFYGAVEHCMTRIREIWNDAKVCVLLPLQRENQYSATSGKALLDYANIIKEIADLLSYPCLDLYHNANFCPVNKYDRNRWTYEFPSESTYAGQHDGLHPNEEFCRDRLAITIGRFIENI